MPPKISDIEKLEEERAKEIVAEIMNSKEYKEKVVTISCNTSSASNNDELPAILLECLRW